MKQNKKGSSYDYDRIKGFHPVLIKDEVDHVQYLI